MKLPDDSTITVFDDSHDVVALGAQCVGDEVCIGVQDVNTKKVTALWLGTGDALLLARNIHDAIEGDQHGNEVPTDSPSDQ